MKSNGIRALCIFSTVYTLWYMHFGKPWTNDGALSKIGLEQRAAFIIWGILTFLSLGLNIYTGYRKIEKQKTSIILLGVSAVGMALTLIYRFDYNLMPDYYLHCAGSLLFSAVTGGAVLTLFLLAKRKTFSAVTAAVMLTDLICLLIFKETGIIETVPIFTGYILLSIFNTGSEKLEAARKA